MRCSPAGCSVAFSLCREFARLFSFFLLLFTVLDYPTVLRRATRPATALLQTRTGIC